MKRIKAILRWLKEAGLLILADLDAEFSDQRTTKK